jgi:hypothetical protein
MSKTNDNIYNFKAFHFEKIQFKRKQKNIILKK